MLFERLPDLRILPFYYSFIRVDGQTVASQIFKEHGGKVDKGQADFQLSVILAACILAFRFRLAVLRNK